MQPSPGPEDLIHGDSLGACMARVYCISAGNVARRIEADELRRAWPRSERAFRAALERIGETIWFDAPGPHPPERDRCVLAMLDPPTGSVRFEPALGAEVWRHPAAYRFAADGSALG
jgi:hypothetical protein